MGCSPKGPLLALVLWLAGCPAHAQFGPDHVVLSPAVITSSTPIQASVPVYVCWHQDPVAVVTGSLIQVTGSSVKLTVNSNWSGICFAAGDSAVEKAVPFMLPRLPAGAYVFSYERYTDGRLNYHESVAFTVIPAASYSGLWWKSPAGSESGWGLSIEHQGDILFCVWYTYGADRNGVWLVMPNGAKTGDGVYSGTLYRTTGPPFDSQPWSSSAVGVLPVGTVTLTFSDANTGVFTYTFNGVTQSKPIARQIFSPAAQ